MFIDVTRETEAAIHNKEMAKASICTVGSKNQKTEPVHGSLVYHVCVRPAVRLILAAPYSLTEPTPDGKIHELISRVSTTALLVSF